MAGMEHVDEILSVPGLDVALIGPYDLSTSMGIPGEVNHPRMVRAVDAFLKSCKRHGVVPGNFVTSVEDGRAWLRRGMRFLIYRGGFHAAHGAQPTGSRGAPSEGEITWPVIAENSRSCAPTHTSSRPRQELEILGKLNCEIVPAVCKSEDETIAACRDAHAVLNNGGQDHPRVDRRTQARPRHLPVRDRRGHRGHPGGHRAGIVVANVPDFCFDEVADTAMSLILSVPRKVHLVNAAVQQGHLEQGRGQTGP